jgi:hypothetical protein
MTLALPSLAKVLPASDSRSDVIQSAACTRRLTAVGIWQDARAKGKFTSCAHRSSLAQRVRLSHAALLIHHKPRKLAVVMRATALWLVSNSCLKHIALKVGTAWTGQCWLLPRSHWSWHSAASERSRKRSGIRIQSAGCHAAYDSTKSGGRGVVIQTQHSLTVNGPISAWCWVRPPSGL